MQGQNTGWPPIPLFLRPGHSRHALPTTAGPHRLVLELPPEVSDRGVVPQEQPARAPAAMVGFRACRTRAAPALPEGSMSVPAPSGAGWDSRQACREQQPPLRTLGSGPPVGGKDPPDFSVGKAPGAASVTVVPLCEQLAWGLWGHRTPGPSFLLWPHLIQQHRREGAPYVRLCLEGACRPLPFCMWQPLAFNSSSLSRLGTGA